MIDEIGREKIKVDGVYVDSAYGVAGTAWPIGTPGMPVSNIPNAKTIAAARNTRVLRLVNPTDSFVLDAALDNYVVIGTAGDQELGSINFNGQSVDRSIFERIGVYGAVNCGLVGTACYDCDVYLDGMSGVGLFHHCRFYDLFLAANAKVFLFDCYSEEYTLSYILGNPGVVIEAVNYSGYFELLGITTGTHNLFFANAYVKISPSCTAGTINIYGDARVVDNHGGTCTVNNYTNRPRAEVKVNITAVNGSETNFLNLATAGFHYTIDDLVLKCADPGADTVTVRLYKLVNGASVLIHSFAIVPDVVALSRGITADFTYYLGLDDMFTRTQLAGDNIKITVQASANGPYAVTGSYSYRSG